MGIWWTGLTTWPLMDMQRESKTETSAVPRCMPRTNAVLGWCWRDLCQCLILLAGNFSWLQQSLSFIGFLARQSVTLSWNFWKPLSFMAGYWSERLASYRCSSMAVCAMLGVRTSLHSPYTWFSALSSVSFKRLSNYCPGPPGITNF